jgi:hypothetical protein
MVNKATWLCHWSLELIPLIDLYFGALYLSSLYPLFPASGDLVLLPASMTSASLSFHVRERTCSTCLSVPDTFHVTNILRAHLCGWKWQNFILFYGWAILHCMFSSQFLCIHLSMGTSILAFRIAVQETKWNSSNGQNEEFTEQVLQKIRNGRRVSELKDRSIEMIQSGEQREKD